MKDVYDILRETSERPLPFFTLATLVRARGSSYRRPGARMLICADGRTIGSLSGGCLEEEVARHGRAVAETGMPTLVNFDTRRRFGCHGSIDILIERLPATFFEAVREELVARKVCLVQTSFAAREIGSWIVAPNERLVGHEAILTQEIQPPLRLFVFGDGPDSVPIRQLGELLGWQVVPAYTSLTITPDRWTAALVKSHHYGRDFAALQTLLPLNLPYVGLIGPRRRRDQLLNDLLDIGLPINAGFFAPAGLDLGSATPEEIAFAVVAEIQRIFSGGTGESLRERKVPIHAAEAELDQKCPAPLP